VNSEQGMDGKSYLSEEVWLTPLLGMSHHFKSHDWLILQVWWKWMVIMSKGCTLKSINIIIHS